MGVRMYVWIDVRECIGPRRAACDESRTQRTARMHQGVRGISLVP